MSSSDEVLNDISETRTTEVLNVGESDGNHDNDMEEDGANDSRDDEFPITNVSKMASYDEHMTELNKIKYGDELGTSSSDSDDPEKNWLKAAHACANGGTNDSDDIDNAPTKLVSTLLFLLTLLGNFTSLTIKHLL